MEFCTKWRIFGEYRGSDGLGADGKDGEVDDDDSSTVNNSMDGNGPDCMPCDVDESEFEFESESESPRRLRSHTVSAKDD